MEKEVKKNTLEEVIEAVSEKHDADIIFYNGEIARPCDQDIIDNCISRRRRKNVILILVTGGGDADSAYRIAKCLQGKYENFICYVSGYCKSAGTLLVLGANKIIFSDHGELGPLDVQLSKKDDLFQLQSGFTVMDALTALQDKAFLSFENTFLALESKSEGAITVKTAGEIASNLTSGLFSSLFGQVDPMHIGESARALSIANAYGMRLMKGSGNWTEETLSLLLSGYPSHGFVIDRIEAETLFDNLREPEGDEVELAKLLKDEARRPISSNTYPIIKFLNKEKELTPVSNLPNTNDGTENNGQSTQQGAA